MTSPLKTKPFILGEIWELVLETVLKELSNAVYRSVLRIPELRRPFVEKVLK